MNTQTIELNRLHAHPANSNVMPEHLLAKLVDHVAGTGRYPPLIVRSLPSQRSNGSCPAATSEHFQILDGHHRVQALNRLGYKSALCVIWDVDDQEALLLLATLNRLEGQDDPRKRAGLIATLAGQHDIKALAKILPERNEQVKKLLEINTHLPTPRAPQPIDSMPTAVHFFLLPKQKQRLNDRLRVIGGTREEALMKLINPSA